METEMNKETLEALEEVRNDAGAIGGIGAGTPSDLFGK